MKIILLFTGKTNEKFVSEGIELYMQRLKYYIPVTVVVTSDLKNTRNLTTVQRKEMEGERILREIRDSDKVCLLDEKGEMKTSSGFAGFIEKQISQGTKRLVFVTGGACGFSGKVHDRADIMLSLSRMTFPHQLIRLVFAEQLYRAMTILKGEPYHNA